ncbi:DUF2953 domain-containing protein [Heliorestis convoluta]|uniref:DUF2953 domain-containing protein n=1 Tax=Heliorestis convoluta TaxID=356322 RepID=A0A5Q2N3M2_9FIRM|nr:DUF2953 domain-containing protein [Heliorestis convoluta]QGG49407.1 hypothetical protein FTV88_3342 [Heliorestis convoluta]
MVTKLILGTLLVGTLLLSLGVLLFQLPLTLQITYDKKGAKNRVDVNLLLFNRAIPLVKNPFTSKIEKNKKGLPSMKAEAPQEKHHEKEMMQMFGTLQRAIPKTRQYLSYLRRNAKKLQIRKLHWGSHVGGTDALETAMLSGFLWTLKMSLLGRFFYLLDRKDEKPRVFVNPWYQGKRFDMHIDCIVTLRPGHIIFTGLWHAGIMPPVLSKGGEGKNEPSHRRSYANSHGKYQRNG